MQQAKTYFSSAREREFIRRRRAAGELPWTVDPVFQAWRFCNVHRENDKTTAWFREQIREPLRGAPAAAQVLAAVVFRWFNRIETGEAIKPMLTWQAWDTEEARSVLRDRHPVVTGAYVIKTPDGMNKLDGILWCIDSARLVLPDMVMVWGDSLQCAWEDLKTLPYLGGFMAYEIVSDLRWTEVLSGAHDIQTWANAGPGCARGLGHVVHDDPDAFRAGSKRDQALMLDAMHELLEMSRDETNWPFPEMPWEMREVEHWACEYDKLVRAWSGEKLKRRFK